MTPRELRDQWLVAVGPATEGDLDASKIPSGSGEAQKNYRVELTVVRRTGGEENATPRLVSATIAPEAAMLDEETEFQVDDLITTGNAAARDATTTDDCWGFQPFATVPKMDFYFVVDGDGPEGYADRIRQFARNLQSTVSRRSLDHRFGVTNTQPDNAGRLVDGSWQRLESELVQALDDAALDCQASEDWTCSGADQHGLQVALEGFDYLCGEGEESAPEEMQFRTGSFASQMNVFVSDEDAATIAGGASLEDYRPLRQRASRWAMTPESACDGLPETTAYDRIARHEEMQLDLRADVLPERAGELVCYATILATPIRFPESPISPSIGMWLDGQSVSRSTAHGFDYSSTSNTLVFPGDCRLREFAPGKDIVGFAHYQYFR